MMPRTLSLSGAFIHCGWLGLWGITDDASGFPKEFRIAGHLGIGS
jgi:hypothetical protein